MKNSIIIAVIVSLWAGSSESIDAQIRPYPDITASNTGIKNSYSPDPIYNYWWQKPSITDDLESYILKPKACRVSDN